MRRILVTAGAIGIGKEVAAEFLLAGDSVYACDIDRAALLAAAQELPGLKTGVCDVRDRKQIEAMMADAVSQLGGLDILINNTETTGPTAPVQDVDPDQWEAVLKVVLTGTFLVTKAAIPHLIAAGAGVIITMSPSGGRFGYANRSTCSTVKWGLIGFMKTLAIELGIHNIRSNAISPGAMEGEVIMQMIPNRTYAADQLLMATKAGAMINQSMKSLVDPKDTAALAVFLASDAAKSISGQTLPIDGDMQCN